ncbi:phage baseplate assembly protein V [Micromonospora sp. WMMA1363]|uniref:phage baseplate assembly protein V n=1 Tax=Micromonospora sp. WMMA1363 TaxID=3053985 RepID=UPI00259CE4BC|nr:phage baseplate assembly protein V [Micromonospora sp. WMMA1363]MDM4722260.1 phage baseplate assembly protein V [Micromonospora sp. WMMA1363]
MPAVLIDGAPLPVPAMRQLRSMRVAARLDVPTQCEIVFSAAPGAAAIPPWARTGTALRVWLTGSTDLLFTGEVTCVEVEYAADGAALLRLRAYDPLHRLRRRQQLRVFTSVTAAELADQLCAGLGLVVDATADGPRLDRLLQHRNNDLDLLLQTTGRAGLHVTVDQDRLRLVTLDGFGDPVELALGRNVFALRISTNLDQAAGATAVRGWRPGLAEPIEQRADRARSGRRIPLRPEPGQVGADGVRTILNQPVRSDDEAAALAQAGLDARVAALVTAAGTADGDPALRPGRRISLTGVATPVAGVYVLTEVVHTVDANGHLTHFSTAPPDPPPTVVPPAPATVTLGLVTDIDDPDRLGRIQVNLPAYGGLDAGWLEVTAPGAGRGRGIVALPDPGDTVLVVLPGGEPSAGLVLGSLFGAIEPYDSGVVGGRSRRWSMRTSTGQSIVIDDDGRSLRLATDYGSRLEITPERTTLHAASELVLSAPGRAMVVRAGTVDFQHAGLAAEAADAAGRAATGRTGGGGG